MKFTIVAKKFFCWERYVERNILKMGTLSVDAGAYPHKIKTNYEFQ